MKTQNITLRAQADGKFYCASEILLEEDSFVEFDRMAFDETWHNT